MPTTVIKIEIALYVIAPEYPTVNRIEMRREIEKKQM